MRSISNIYSEFARVLGTSLDARKELPSFRSICKELRVSPSSLNEILFEELGLTGEELLRSLNKGRNIKKDNKEFANPSNYL